MEINPKKIKLYCKNPSCFMHYIANHKLKEEKKDLKVIKKKG